jgi:SAM-dependent methyltransferase
MTAQRVRARVFGEVAEEYDRIRPGYPAALFDDVLSYAATGTSPALEVGAGTGKATVALAQRGVTIDAIEPDEAMARLLAHRVADHCNVAVRVCSFEDFVPQRPYGLLFCAQAWHWTDPAVRWRRAAEALVPGGALALFWNHDCPVDADVATALGAVHRRHLPGFDLRLHAIDPAELAADWPRTDLDTLAEFGDLSGHLYSWERRLATADFVAFLSTQSAYRLLDDTVRADLFRAISDVLGDEITLQIQTALYLARRV